MDGRDNDSPNNLIWIRDVARDKKIKREMAAFQHWTLRRTLKISWTEKKTNKEVRSRMNMTGLTFRFKIKERFRYLGHILRGSA